MNSSPLKNVSKLTEDYSLNEELCDMSPVTDLALNLKSLKATLAATPTRRISWSDPFKSGEVSRCCMDSPSADSPMMQEILKKNVKRSKKIVPRILDSEDSKENIPPEEEMQCENSICDESDSVVGDSQDSGYCGKFEKKLKSINYGSTPRLRVRSSLFTDTTDSQDVDSLFAMDSDIEPTPTLSMESLLTKPLCRADSADNIDRSKSSIRRCLTMEMEHSSIGSFSSMQLDLSECYSQTPSTSVRDNDSSTDSEPFRRLPFKRPDPSSILAWQSKRRKSSPSVIFLEEGEEDTVDFVKQRSFSETAATIMQAVQKADLQPDLIGDCSRCYALPLTKGRHQDLKCISSETLVQVLRGDFKDIIDGYTLIDCRYPYEYEGGHIRGAQNIYTKEEIIQKFLENTPASNSIHAIIFHCEFSSERAPKLCRFLRNKDREQNECNYPKLHHPEMYLLEGGYKEFYANYREYCEPQDYKPMNHKDHSSDLRFFRAKSKSFGNDLKSRFKIKAFTQNFI